MEHKEYYFEENPVPEDFHIFERVKLKGVYHRKDEAKAFINSEPKRLELEREPNNPHDKNAIKVMGCTKGFLGTKRRFMGYVPRETARRLIEGGFWGNLQARLVKTYIGESGFVEILFHVLGPKERLMEYAEYWAKANKAAKEAKQAAKKSKTKKLEST